MSIKGLLPQRIEHLRRTLSSHVERGDVPGLVALVSCGDDVLVESLGTMALGESPPMRRDAIFRVASLVKPVTAVAAMILVEECKLRLEDSIEQWLPELADRRVLRSVSSQLDDTVPAERAITVRDLLTFRMGFGSVMAPPDTCPIQALIRDYKIGCDGPPLPAQAPPTQDWLNKLGSLPWLAQPGKEWLYQTSADVLGVLIGRVSGRSLGEFMRERIFDPLGMGDTGFFVRPEDLHRLPVAYDFNPASAALEVFDGVEQSAWLGQPPFESGGGGLVSTIDDYFAFCRMMLDRGQFGGEQIISRASVELMTSDQITPEQRAGGEAFFGAHASWGFVMAVDIARTEIFHSPGRFGWDGGLGTSAYTDPLNDLIGIIFTQRLMGSPNPPMVFADFWTLAYAAMR